MEREAAREREVLRRGVRPDIDGVTHAVRRSGERVHLQPVHAFALERRDALQALLKERGIGTSIYYPLPLHLQPCFAYLGYEKGSCPESERAAKEVLSLPDLSRARRAASSTKSSTRVRAFYGRR